MENNQNTYLVVDFSDIRNPEKENRQPLTIFTDNTGGFVGIATHILTGDNPKDVLGNDTERALIAVVKDNAAELNGIPMNPWNARTATLDSLLDSARAQVAKPTV